jgi:transposase
LVAAPPRQENLKPLLPPASNLGWPRKTDLRDIVDAIFYRYRNGCTWRALPHEFPTWRTVFNEKRRLHPTGPDSPLASVRIKDSVSQIPTRTIMARR